MTHTTEIVETYEVNAVVPPSLVPSLLTLLQRHGGQFVRMVPHQNGHSIPRKPGKVTAREAILAALQANDGEVHRENLRKVLEASGHSPASVGPTCSMLQKQNRVFSPRRGFWQIRA